jgi:hypothetical protein
MVIGYTFRVGYIYRADCRHMCPTVPPTLKLKKMVVLDVLCCHFIPDILRGFFWKALSKSFFWFTGFV